MPAEYIPYISLRKRLLRTKATRLLGVVLAVMAVQIQQAGAQDLVLQDTTISTTEEVSATNSITAGPNVTVTSSGQLTLSAPEVTLKPRFTVVLGGRLQVVQGYVQCPITLAGDVNLSGAVTAADIIDMVEYVLKSGPLPLPCAANGDVNCSGAVTAADIIDMVEYAFRSGPPFCDICNDPSAMECVPNP
jgi:hypothetical protein